MKDLLEKIVINSNLLVDATSFTIGQKDFFMLDLYGLLKKHNKKIYIKRETQAIVEKCCTFFEKEKVAKEGLSILTHYQKEGLITEINSLADLVSSRISVFNEDRVGIQEELKVLKKVGFNGEISFFKIEKGFPVEIEVKGMAEKRAKLLISISMDNSASMKGEKMDKLKQALFSFNERLENEGLLDTIEFSTTIFSGFNCVVAKPFEEISLVKEKYFAGGMPFVDLSITKCIEKINERIAELDKNQNPYYKPWLIVLSNGENFGDVSNSIEHIKKMVSDGKLTYFPFALSDRDFDGSLNILRRLKKFITIRDNMYDELFNWIFTIAKKRVETPLEQSFGIEATSYDGWTVK